MLKFLDDLQLAPECQVMLIVGWKIKAATQCELSREEFINGMIYLGCDSIDMLRQRCATLEEVKDPAEFKDMYDLIFNYANPVQNRINHELDLAIAYYRLVKWNALHVKVQAKLQAILVTYKHFSKYR